MAAAGEVLTQAVSRPHSDAKTSTTDDGLSAFVGVRSRLFAIAYRMLGSAAEAEDIVQDAWLRWQTTDRSVVRDPPAFLAATTTRLCINVAQSARSRRETCAGPWLPEPIDTSADPALGAERGEALRLAVLVLLAKLCPTERAAYVLREAFDYPHRQIADILQMEEANVRQLVSRARKHLVDGRRAYACAADQRRLLVAFITACRTGDLAALEGLLAADVVFSPDGDGVVRAARVPVSCRERIAKFIAAVAKQLWEGVSLDWIDINGQGALLMSHDCASVRSLR